MKNKEFTKVYEGLQSLIRVAMGDSVSNDTYFEFKKYFRYPGELLERMEQYGYGSADDYLSAIAALRWAKNRKLDISEMCVGTQLEDFLKKAEEKGKEENDLLLLYSVICYENDATEITGDDLATLLDAAKENTQESVVYFLKKILDDRIHHWNLQGYVDKFLLASKILVLKMDSISSLAQEDVCECADFFMDLMEVSYALKHISEQFSLSIKENMGAASDIILVFSDLYKEPVKKSYEKKLLEAGFSNMDILNLNMGIWYVYERTTELYVSSEIKWWRLAKRWFQSLFLQDKEVPFDGNRLMNLFDKKMPRKIDGEDLAPKFLLAGFAHGIPCVNNSYLLFYILTMYGSYRHSSERVNQLSLWESICTNHPFRIDSEDELEWMRGLLGYEWNSRDKYFMQRIYVLLLSKVDPHWNPLRGILPGGINMDINAEACIKQGEELGMIAKKKSALKYQMQSFANNLICTNPKDSLEKLCQLCLIYEIDAMPLIEVMSENDEQNCQKACQYFISGFTKGNSSSIRKKQA